MLFYLYVIFYILIFYLSCAESGEYEAIVVAGDGDKQSKDGMAKECSFANPCGIAVDEKTHTCFVADSGTSSIRKITFVD
jgi:hypothetical protein